MIFLTQMKDFFGLPVAAPSGFFPTVEMLKNHLASFDPATLGLAAASLALILFWPKRLNKFLPSPFVALIPATLAAAIMPWTWRDHRQQVRRHPAGAAGIPPAHF